MEQSRFGIRNGVWEKESQKSKEGGTAAAIPCWRRKGVGSRQLAVAPRQLSPAGGERELTIDGWQWHRGSYLPRWRGTKGVGKRERWLHCLSSRLAPGSKKQQ